MPQQIWHLKNNELFTKLKPERLSHLESRCRSRSFAAHSPVYLPSQSADSVFLLASGLVKVCNLTNDGKQSILAFVEPGEMFGELAIFESEQRDEYVEAVEKSTVVMIPASELQELMAANHDVSIALTRMIGLRRHRVERRLKNLLFLSNRDRLVHLLLDLAEQFGIRDTDGIRLRIKLAHQEIANLMGSTRETVTILLGQLKSEGMVDVGRQRIVLVQAEQLAMSVHRKMPSLNS
ncbi:cAMP-binding domain of CRP or a regulatory subunit of cAMP-dependent protein kinases [Neorhodopirellula lusitana]|uniref:cAMP-binding domain of CRP or a regulatory subunit of cAMP-dependent protein kinases n=1 Tax=Neorhodopirellula lusitana TaxID=445327 RepID=A0ABY1PR72_9BACT|nr:Crp/Fnr family transcriptional regulator [Neorhodopirellula lusitana]SMP43487.1 cAMP-binding domain of CRP or a regulatory subunit of cAMP-dependent protein kinases [Neorhodopirellula lusitana]